MQEKEREKLSEEKKQQLVVVYESQKILEAQEGSTGWLAGWYVKG